LGRAEEDWFQKGLSLSQERRYEEAIEAFSKALEVRPDHADAFNNRGAVWYYKKDYAKAIEDYTRAIEFRPESADFYNNRGAAWLHRKDWDRAQRDFEQAIQMDPRFVEAYRNLGIVLYIKLDYEGAIREYTRALAVQPDSAEILNNRGAAFYQQGHYFKALQDYTGAVELAPGFAEAYKNRGIVWFRMGYLAKAIEDYGRALKADPAFADAYKNRGIAWYHTGKYNDALNDYIEALRLEPASVEANNQLAWMLSVCPDPKYRNASKALDLAKRAVSLSEGPTTLDTLAAAHAEFGDFKEAVEIQERVVAQARASGTEELKQYIQRLDAYKDRRPWRSVPGAEKTHPFPAQGVISVSAANIRSDSSTQAEVLAKLGRGERAALLWKEGEWYLLELTEGRLGWVHESVVSKVPATVKQPVIASRTLTVSTDLGRVREEPSLDSGILFRVNKGEVINLMEEKGDWRRIALHDGRSGWAHKSLFAESPQSVPLPSAGAEETRRVLVVGVDLARVREKADRESAIIRRLKRGESVLCHQTVDDWHQVALPDGRTGWAHKGLFVQK
jgi:tetratricopeptide (TPR) repeat protein